LAAEMMHSHLSQASNAKFPVDQIEDRRHDRTPLFDHRPPSFLMIISSRLRRSRKIASSAWKIVSWELIE
jgi:hypothetical protein